MTSGEFCLAVLGAVQRNAALLGFCLEKYGKKPMILFNVESVLPPKPDEDYPAIGVTYSGVERAMDGDRDRHLLMLSVGILQTGGMSLQETVNFKGTPVETSVSVASGQLEAMDFLALVENAVVTAKLGTVRTEMATEVFSVDGAHETHRIVSVEILRSSRHGLAG